MGRLNINDMQAKLASVKSNNYTTTEYDKLAQGKNVRRVLWPKGEYDSFYSEGYLHYGLGPEGRTTVTCPRTWDDNAPCPICEYSEELSKSKSKDNQKLAVDLRAKRRIFINVLNRDEGDDNPKVLPIGVTILKGLLEIICDPDYGDITDYDEGTDVTITRKGQGLQTEYSVLAKRNSSVASDDKSMEELEDEMADLNALFVHKSYEELANILNEADEEDEDSEFDDYDTMELDELRELCEERGIRVSPRDNRLKLITALTKYDQQADELDDEDEDFEDEEEIEEEPVRPVRSKKTRRVVEEIDEDEDDADSSIQDAISSAISRRHRNK